MIRFKYFQTRVFVYFVVLALLFPLTGWVMYRRIASIERSSNAKEALSARLNLATELSSILTTEQLILMEVIEEKVFDESMRLEYEALEYDFIRIIRLLKHGGTYKGVMIAATTDEKSLQMLQSIEDRFLREVSTPIGYMPRYMDTLEFFWEEDEEFREEDIGATISLRDEAIDQTAEDLKGTITALGTEIQKDLQKNHDTLTSIIGKSFRLILVGSIIVVLVAILLGFVLSNRLLQSIKRIVLFAQKLGAGKLDTTYDISQDEQELQELTTVLSNMAKRVDALQKEAQDVLLLLDEVPLPVVKVDKNGSVMQANKAAEHCCTTISEDMKIDALMGDAAKNVHTVLSSGSPWSGHVELQISGHMRYMYLSVTPIGTPQSPEAVIVATDLSSSRKRQKSIKEQVKSSLERVLAFETVADELICIADTSTEMMEGALQRTLDEDVEMAEVVQRVSEVDQQLERVSTAMVQMSASIHTISNQADSTQHVTNEAAQSVESISEQVDMLGIATSNIRGIVDLISEIAEQTNLLALNATIEAARAGDAGSGFAVVAKEVKALATQTNDATREIQEKIDRINSQVDETVAKVRSVHIHFEKLMQNITAMAGAMAEQQSSSSEVSESVQVVASKMRIISEKANHTTEASLQNSDALGKVSEDVKRIGTVADTVQSESSVLAQNMQKLGEEAAQM